MDWARILAFATGMVDQELLARIEISGRRKSHPEGPVEGTAEALRRRASHARRDRSFRPSAFFAPPKNPMVR
jgi:hypothetical protein